MLDLHVRSHRVLVVLTVYVPATCCNSLALSVFLDTRSQ